ncbi:MAG: SGNH/GDSL hydrolase family protein [Myxococcota bacterium]
MALVLLAAEALLRVLPEKESPMRGLHRAEPGAPWLYALAPGAVVRVDGPASLVYEVNEAGFRGPAPARTKPADRVRVLVMGDSVAFGYGVAEPDTFARRLEGAEGGGRLEVLNFGVGGYNPYNEAALLRGRGLAWQPDVVLAQFCINDLNDPTAHFDHQTRLALGEIPPAAYPDPEERNEAVAKRSCLGHPCTCSKLCSAVQVGYRGLTGASPPVDVATLAPRELPPGPSRRWLGAQYGAMATTAREVEARFAVVVFPYRSQVESGRPATVQAQLAALGRERGFEVIDLLPAFLAAGRDEALFLDLWHPTPAGHRVAAEVIHGRLRELGWLAATAP